jgi:hypothetical protein
MGTELQTDREEGGAAAARRPRADGLTSRLRSVPYVVWGWVAAALVGVLLVVLLAPTGSDEPTDDSTGSAVLPTLGSPPDAGTSGVLSFAPPALDDPETIRVTDEENDYTLEDGRDYEIVLPDEPLRLRDGLRLNGGRNVVLIGGRIEAEERGLYLRDQTGTVHVEGLSIGGEGLKEGINLAQTLGATVQLQNISVDMVTGSYEGWHADLLQTWAGPRVLLVDGFSGTTGYQGFFLTPFKFHNEIPQLWDLRRVIIRGDTDAAYLLWTEKEAPWVTTSDVAVHPAERKERSDVIWGEWQADVIVGDAGSVRLPDGEPGVGYESPGYVGE